MSKPRIGIIVGSTRASRFADVPTAWIQETAEKRDDLAVEVLDLRDYPMPFFDEPVPPAWAPVRDEAAQRWGRKVDEMDGFIVVAGEYNRGPAAVLKNALDYAYNEWGRKPVTFVGYGGAGGARAVEQLRLNAVELQMAPIRHAVHILLPDFLAVRGGKPLGEIEHLNKAATEVLDHLAWWARTLKAARDADRLAAAA